MGYCNTPHLFIFQKTRNMILRMREIYIFRRRLKCSFRFGQYKRITNRRSTFFPSVGFFFRFLKQIQNSRFCHIKNMEEGETPLPPSRHCVFEIFSMHTLQYGLISVSNEN